MQKTILCVEDDQDVANLMRLLINRAPVNLMVAHNTSEARRLMDQQDPDLILLDLMLPGKSGLDFLAELRSDPQYANTPVIIVSVRTGTAQRLRARELGVQRYFVKPFAPVDLRQEIQSVLGVDWSSYWDAPGKVELVN